LWHIFTEMKDNIIIQGELMGTLKRLVERHAGLDDLFENRVISKRLRNYIEQLLILDHLSEEAEVYAKRGYTTEAINSLTEMREHLDFIAGMYLSDLPPIEDKATGLLFVNLQGLIKSLKKGSLEDYRPLFEFAEDKCKQATSRIEKSVGAIAN